MDAFQRIRLSQTCCYLLKANDGYILIDCGCAADERTLLSKLESERLNPRSIRYLLLTHHHSDHCGLLSFLLSANPDIRVIMSEKCAAYLETGRHFSPDGERYAVKAMGGIMRVYRQMSGNMTDVFLPYFKRDCDVLCASRDRDLPNFMGCKGRLIQTPGHTEGSISLVVGEHAFVGDAVRNILNFLGATYEPILYYDRRTCYESWTKLLSTGVKYIHPAHGPSLRAERLIDRLRHFETAITKTQDHPFR